MSLKNILVALAVLLLGGCQSIETTQVSASQIEPTIAISQDSDGDGVIDDLDWCPATPPRVMIDNNGCPPNLLPDDKFIMMEVRIFYQKGSSEISHQYLEDLDKAGKIMQSREDTVITIEGHISEDEDTAANQTLAQIRAEGAKNYLMLKYGVEAERIKTFTYGAKRPLAPNDDVEGVKVNRRVYALVKNVEQD